MNTFLDSELKQKKVLIMAGGTGGHVFPALSVARALSERGVYVEWLGTQKGLESDLVPKANIHLNIIDIQGVRGKGILSWIKLPYLLVTAVLQARRILRKVKPDVVVGMGGFASGPGAIAARLAGIPLLIHEQNAIAGTTNRWLAKIAKIKLEAFPNSLPSAKVVGNPVRQEISKLSPPQERYYQHGDAKHLLVLGGSLGALKLNQLVPAAIALMQAQERPDIWHQTGKMHLNVTQTDYEKIGVDAKVEAFIEDMAAAYEWADLVVCRAGALTVAEITAAGVASILVPFPHAIDDHQTKNAEWLVHNGAALLQQQDRLTPAGLRKLLCDLFQDRSRLQAMAINARNLALPDAANQVAESCLALAS